MRILTDDIPQETYDFMNKYGTDGGIVEKAVVNGTVIPDNATNGDIIKAIFPNAIIEINELGNMVHVKYNEYTCWVNYELEWWNAPYKGVN